MIVDPAVFDQMRIERDAARAENERLKKAALAEVARLRTVAADLRQQLELAFARERLLTTALSKR